jgi:hypothetical protein
MPGARIGELGLGPGVFQLQKDDSGFWEAHKEVAIDLSSSEIRGDLALCAIEADGAFIFDNSTVGRNLTAKGGHFTNPGDIAFSAVNAIVGNNVEMYPYGGDFEADGMVDFTTAQVQGNFVVIGARFRGAPDHDHGLRAGGLVVRGGFLWQNVTLENGAILDLGNARFGGLLDEERSWPTPGKLLIDGLTYEHFGSDTPRDIASRLKWLRLQPGFHPQPYKQFATFLRENGDDAGSLKILAAKDEAESQQSSNRSQILNRRVALQSPLGAIAVVGLMLATLVIAARRYLIGRASRAPQFGVQLSAAPPAAASLQSGCESVHPSNAPAGDGRFSTNDGAEDSAQQLPSEESRTTASPQAIFRKEGEFWTISYDKRTFRLKDAKGLHYIAHLLSHPGEKFRVHDLVAVVEGQPDRAKASARSLPMLEVSGDLGDLGPILDDKAKANYRRRRQELREELDEAEAMNDEGRAERVRSEIEMLEQQLSAAIGLGGRDRKTSAHSERARVVVTRNIRAMLGKIAEEHPILGRHFSGAIKTGYLCTYLPEPDGAVAWKL